MTATEVSFPLVKADTKLWLAQIDVNLAVRNITTHPKILSIICVTA